MKKYFLCGLLTISLTVLTVFCACSNQAPETIDAKYAGLKHNDNYTLEQMTVLSRHNVRSPLTSPESDVAKNCAHEWYNWTSKSGELSLDGGINETAMGQYFRQYLEQEKMIPENWIPIGDETYFYTNTAQRTYATAKYFSTGMMPVAPTTINCIDKVGGKADDTFLPIIHTDTPQFQEQVKKEVNEVFDGDYKSIDDKMQDNLKLIEDVIGYKGEKPLAQGDPELVLKVGKEGSSTGFVKDLTPYADALAMQYYEEPDDSKAAFGKKLSNEEWTKIGDVLGASMLITGGSITEARDMMNAMLKEIKKDIQDTDRKFTFLCGHDSTLTPVLTALKAQRDPLPYTFTKVSPIGGKVVFSKLKNAAGEEFISINYVYGSDNQIRYNQPLNLNNPPVAFPIELQGLEKNADGFYKLNDIINRLDGLN